MCEVLRECTSGSRVLVVGDVNIDLVLTGLQGMPQLGREIMMSDIQLAIGGSCGIFSSALASLGAYVRLVAAVGDDYLGYELKKMLKNAGVDTQGIITNASDRTGVTICLSYRQDRAQVTYAGALAHVRAEDLGLLPLGCSHLHLSSYYLMDELRPDLPALLRIARGSGMTVSLDPQGDPRGRWDKVFDVLPYVDLFLPNAFEALAIADVKDLEEALVFYRAQCPAVAIKMGEEGSLADLGDGPIQTDALCVEALDTTGAGDCFDAALVHTYILKKLPSRDALSFANAAAALSVSRVGGCGFSSHSEVERLLAETAHTADGRQFLDEAGDRS